MIFAASLVLIAVATLLFLGWGWAFLRLLRLELAPWPRTVALGMAAVVCIGGILNLARLAYPAALMGVTGIGLLLSILALRDGVSLVRPPLILMVLTAIVMIFTIATQLPPSVYNFHDDYQKYFAYPVRMVQTGTVFGSPLSAIGLQTLGAQSFLDGFIVAFFPIRYVNGVDAIFGLFLCLLLAPQFTRDRKDLWPVTMISFLSVVIINPQYVNISTLFCGSALIMAITAVEDSASLGLLYAALIAMKPIFAVFVTLHLLATGAVRAQALWIVRTGLISALFLSPWALLHAPSYWAGLRAHRAAPTPVPGGINSESINIFSVDALPYGSTAANYTLLVVAIAICGVICWRSKPPLRNALACCVAGVVSFFVFIYLLGPMQYGYEHGMRYFVPVGLGLAPGIFGQTARAERRMWVPLIVAALPLAAFVPSLVTRIQTERSTHSAASYSWLTSDPEYQEYNVKVLSGPARAYVTALQERVPAGEPILAWINTPFFLNYKRNRIIDIDTAGIGVPWARLPPADYLIWDYGGFASADESEYQERAQNAGAGERQDSILTLDFIRDLNKIVKEGDVLFDDGEVEVVRLKGAKQ